MGTEDSRDFEERSARVTEGDGFGGEPAGRVLGGRYRVTRTLGRGGMGVVGRAVDEVLGREVAVKILRAYTDASPHELADLCERMRREAQAAARIRHAGVVTVHDVIEDQGLPVIVMELVDGPSLDDVLAERGTLDPREAAGIGARLMDALAAAHRAGVLHRDVKPGNVLLERGGRVVLTDFGIASVEAGGEEAVSKLTRSGELVGSLDYLPPERAQGHEPGPASDIWSLGMTLYAAVEGASPFRRPSVLSTLTAIVSDPLPEPRRAGALTPVLRALMAKEPQDRPDAERARELLEAVAAGDTMDLSQYSSPAPAPAGAFGPPPARTPPAPPAPGGYAAPAGPPAQPSGRAGYTPGGLETTVPRPAAAARGGADAGRKSSPGADRRARRTVVAAAAAAVVIAGGGVAYALVGTHGSAGDGTGGSGPAALPAISLPVADGSPSMGKPVHGMTSSSPSASSAPSGGASGAASQTPGGPGASDGPAPSSTAGGGAPPVTSAPSPSTASTGCGGWTHRDPNPGTYGYTSGGNYNLFSGPYGDCSHVTQIKTAKTKLWYHCYVDNAYGNKWYYVRIAGSDTAGWIVSNHLTGQSGPDTRC
ncbi:serine/threonine-protein kinase [Streptantibioticus parmotrematis]|uniref:serine/threonine-protein kinase n=1 Tax=Streptantibioticus parmotrematis TaxID=2873249 RepID=UPI0033F10913